MRARDSAQLISICRDHLPLLWPCYIISDRATENRNTYKQLQCTVISSSTLMLSSRCRFMCACVTVANVTDSKMRGLHELSRTFFRNGNRGNLSGVFLQLVSMCRRRATLCTETVSAKIFLSFCTLFLKKGFYKHNLGRYATVICISAIRELNWCLQGHLHIIIIFFGR